MEGIKITNLESIWNWLVYLTENNIQKMYRCCKRYRCNFGLEKCNFNHSKFVNFIGHILRHVNYAKCKDILEPLGLRGCYQTFSSFDKYNYHIKHGHNEYQDQAQNDIKQ